jgi:predicted GNAT family N-acyltransferase
VAADWQGQGLGRRLLDRLLADTDPAQPVTVNASLLAQAFYARWGFVIQGPAQLQHGVRFQPMVRSVA